MSDILTVGVIGAGVIGQEHMECIADIDCICLAGVMDVDSERVRVTAEKYNAKPYSRLEDLLANPDVEAVLVCTPHTQHLTPVLSAAQAGKHVMLEKPMALTLTECDRMIEACERAGIILMVGQSLRHDQAHIHVRDLIATGTIGDVGHVILRWYAYFNPNQPDNPYGTWYLDRDLGGICILHTFGPHVFDLMPWFVDSPVVRVYAQGSESTKLYQGQSDSFSATLTHESGTVSIVRAITVYSWVRRCSSILAVARHT
jgi:predicted dehydrogenase